MAFVKEEMTGWENTGIPLILPPTLTTTSMKLSDNSKLVIGLILFIGFLILIHGNEIGQFHNTDHADATIDPILYIVCLVSILIFLKKGLKAFKAFNLKDKILTIIIIIVVPLMPMYFLAGSAKWIDYLTTNKKWQIKKVTIINASSSSYSRGVTTYLYNVQIRDTTIELTSTLKFPVGKVLYLKMCRTNAGMIIADEYHP